VAGQLLEPGFRDAPPAQQDAGRSFGLYIRPPPLAAIASAASERQRRRAGWLALGAAPLILFRR
jgi:hypothetical protein